MAGLSHLPMWSCVSHGSGSGSIPGDRKMTCRMRQGLLLLLSPITTLNPETGEASKQRMARR